MCFSVAWAHGAVTAHVDRPGVTLCPGVAGSTGMLLRSWAASLPAPPEGVSLARSEVSPSVRGARMSLCASAGGVLLGFFSFLQLRLFSVSLPVKVGTRGRCHWVLITVKLTAPWY